MTVTRESRRMSRVTVTLTERDVRRESRDPYPTPPYPTHLFFGLVGLSINQVQEEPHLGARSVLGLGAEA